MTTSQTVTIFPHIERTPDVRGGKPCISGTRLTVLDIVYAYLQGHKPEEILTLFSSRPLTLAEVHSALAYHYDHPKEFEEHERRSQEWEKRIEPDSSTFLPRTTREER